MQSFSSRSRSENAINLALLTRVGGGCRNSFAELYERCYAPVTRFAFRYIQDAATVEEIVNDSMLIVWEKAAGFRGESRVMTWILGIVMRKCWQTLRRDKNQRLHDELPADLPALKNELDASHWQMDINLALEALSPEHRACVELAYNGGFSGEEIAEIMDCPVNTVKTRLHHARKYLKAFFSESDVELSDYLSEANSTAELTSSSITVAATKDSRT